MVPFIVLGLSIVSLIEDRDTGYATLTRNCAQFLYCGITFLGLFGFSTNIACQFRRCRISLDTITISIAALCCLCMSLSWAKNIPDKILALLDITANSAAFVYLLAVTTGQRHFVLDDPDTR